jgi:hypothetical protein
MDVVVYGGKVDFGTIYRSAPYQQRGSGFGDIMRSAMNFITPFLTRGLTSLGAEALRSGTEILQNYDKKPFKELVVEQGKKSLSNLGEMAANNLLSMRGKGLVARRRRRHPASSSALIARLALKPTTPKRRRKTTPKKRKKINTVKRRRRGTTTTKTKTKRRRRRDIFDQI